MDSGTTSGQDKIYLNKWRLKSWRKKGVAPGGCHVLKTKW
jgi:hypothetical protein